MATKRKTEIFDLEFEDSTTAKRIQPDEDLGYVKKHTLDSDEEDSGEEVERYNILPEDDIEGEEDGAPVIRDDTKITPFNMKEELEEGHFDREGHFQWDKNKEVRDNWLDNIDWIKVKTDKEYIEKTNTGLADSSDSEDELSDKNFNEIRTYKEIFDLMKPGETVTKTLQRLGGNKAKMSSAERWRLKKAGIIDENSALVTKFTELTNNILTNLGNMDIYQETYEMIKKKIEKKSSKSLGLGHSSTNLGGDDSLDMYADDFDQKEKTKLTDENGVEIKTQSTDINDEEEVSPILQWEFKWKQDDEETHGPYTTEQMQKWVEEKYFKEGVLVRKCGIEDPKFYTSNRIDFELYM